MWEENSPVSTLVGLAVQNDTKGLQLYADSVRFLDFLGDGCKHHRLFKDVTFPKLEHVSIDASDGNEGALLEPYLQSSLKIFQFYGGPISDSFLEKLQKACPQLEEVLIDRPRNLITPQGFLRFLHNIRSLKKLTVMFGMGNVVTDDIFINLAIRPGLRSLALQKCLTPQLISDAIYHQQGLQPKQQVQEEGKLFTDLRELTCTAETEGILSLSSHIPQLSRLSLTLVSNHNFTTPPGGLLLLLSASCPNLQFLHIQYNWEEVTDLHEELLVLPQNLQHLKHLHLHGDNILARELRDTHIVRVAQEVKEMEVLRLGFQCTLTEEALIGLGKYCGGTLVECELWGTCNLASLDSEGVLFPVLKELTVGKIVSTSASPDQITDDAERIAGVLHRCAPRLEFFESMDESSFDQAVEVAWRKLAQQY